MIKLYRISFIAVVLLCLSVTSAFAQDFWIPSTQIIGADDFPLTGNPNVIAGDTAIYVTNAEGMFRSSDRGVTWSVVSHQLHGQGIGIKRVVRTGKNLLLASQLGIDGALYSTNQGSTWQASEGLDFLLVQNMVLHPSGDVFATVRGSVVMRSTNGGVAWTASSSGLPQGHWGEGLILLNNGELLVSTGLNGVHGLYRSSDLGASWSASSTGMPDTLTWTFAQDQLGKVYAGTSGLGVYRSDDNGKTWQQTDTTGIGNADVESIAVGNDTTIFISTEGRGIFRSTNGQTWSYSGDGAGEFINRIVVAQDGYVYAGVPQNIVRSNVSTGNTPGGSGNVNPQTDRQVSIFPNPAHDYLSIVGDINSTATITDLLGRTRIISSTTEGIDIKALEAGVYHISINGAAHSWFVKR